MLPQLVGSALVANILQHQLHVNYVMQTVFHVYQHHPPIALLAVYCRALRAIYSPVITNATLIVLAQLIS